MPEGWQVNVTLTRWKYNTVVDHRYCYVKAGGSNCHTDPIMTTSNVWTYQTTARVYAWTGSTWKLMAWNPEKPADVLRDRSLT